MKTPELKKAIDWIEGQEDHYVKNEYGQYMYSSADKSHGINLPYILADYLEDSATSQIEDLIKEVEKLRKFKEYVHDRLDKMGIPSDPEPESNASHGCRIEGRLNFIKATTDDLLKRSFKREDNLKSSNDRYREALENGIYEKLIEEDNAISNVHGSAFSKDFVEGFQHCMKEVSKALLSALHPLVKEGE